jgi:glycolate oxidase iron-sulfur subunit
MPPASNEHPRKAAQPPRSEPEASEGHSSRPEASEGHSRWQRIHRHSLDCVHCGLCLQACPTYRETGREISSPRGRIFLLRGVAEGCVPLADAVAEEAYLCLGCRACETACPSGVRFGTMLELARAEVEDAGLRRGLARRLERWALRGLVPHRGRLRLAMDLLALAQRLRLDRLARALLPRGLGEASALVPAVPSGSRPRASGAGAWGCSPAASWPSCSRR